jgi:tight adherence protein C
VTGTVLLAGGLGALGMAIVLAVMAMAPARPAQHGVARALTTIEESYAQQSPAGAGGTGADHFTALPGWLRGLAVRLSPGTMASTLQRRLDVAGNPPGWTPDRILGVKGLGLLVLGVLGALYGLHSLAILILAGGFGAVTGFFLPDLLLYNAGLKRQEKIRAALPDALDMLTVCVEAGLGFDAALAQVARNTTGPLAAEFTRALQEMQIGKSRSQALRAMVARTTVVELRSFVSSLVQAGELGIAIAKVLREQAKEMRARRRQRAEERAQQVPVKILFPLVMCLFPALLVVIIGPGALSIAHALLGR